MPEWFNKTVYIAHLVTCWRTGFRYSEFKHFYFMTNYIKEYNIKMYRSDDVIKVKVTYRVKLECRWNTANSEQQVIF